MGERRRKTRLKLADTALNSEPTSPDSSQHSWLPCPCLFDSSKSFIATPLSTSYTLIAISLTVLLIVCTSLCNANEDNSRFALRPFQASPQSLTRRQEVLFDLDTPVARRPPNEPNLVPILTAPVPRGSTGHKPSFQRIRLSKPAAQPLARLQQTPPTSQGFTPVHFTPSESPLTNFQRIANFNQPLQSPVQPLQVPPPIPPLAIPVSPELPQRHSSGFRRVKPSSSGTRRIKLKTASPLQTLAGVIPSRPVEPNSRLVVPNSASPFLPENGAQRLRGRGPVSAQDDDLLHKDNALDNEDNESGNVGDSSSAFFGNRVTDSSSSGDDGIQFIGSLSRPALSSTVAPPPTRTKAHPVHTPTIPLTFYTTYTYYTTFLRGPHTAMLSRELVSSTTAVKPIDRSIVTAIEFSDGYIQQSRTQSPLGIKTKGQTTTIYNVASRVQVFNDDLYKVIYATRASSDPLEPTRISPLSSSAAIAPKPSSKVVISSRVSSRVSLSVASSRIEPTRTFSRPAPPQSQVPAISPSRLEDLNKLPKKLLTKYTYFYTFIDGASTRYSTRMEESIEPFTGNLATMASALDSSIDSEGNLQLLSPKSATVGLGSRAHGRMTTVVNLALDNYVQFDNVRDIHIKPTSVIASSPTLQTPTPSLTPSFEESPLVSSSADQVNSELLSSKLETPRLSSEILLKSSSVIPSSSQTLVTSSQVRTRPSHSRRPIRVKVKPIRSKLATLSRVSSKISISSSLLLQPSSSIVPSETIFSASPSMPSPSPALSSTEIPVSSTPITELSSSSEAILTTPSATPTRKKVAYTVRRPVSGTNRYFNRRPSSYLVRSSTALLSSPTASEYTSSTELLLTPSLASSTEVLPTVSYIPPTSSFSPQYVLQSSSPVFELSSQLLTTPVLKPSKASKSRLVVLTRLAGHLNKWNPLYASRIRVSSRKVLKSTGQLDISSMPIEPTSVVETIFETTTHTVPFTLGSTTIYTTVEETNSRVITRSEESMEASLLSPSFAPESSSVKPTVETLNLPSTVSFETKTQLTTLTHFNTIYKSGSSIVTSSEQTLSSFFSVPTMAPVSSTVVVETSDSVTTSTLYSTYTYFATLFNGTQTMITPLEEVKTEYLTLREPVTITRTIVPTMNIIPSSSIKLGQLSSSVVPMESLTSRVQPLEGSYMTETYSTHTTLTHFITLFSGTRTILSSIEEISPTIMTRTRALLSTESPSISMVDSSSSTTESSRLSPSIVEMASEPMISSSMEAVYSSSVVTSSSVRPSLLSSSEGLAPTLWSHSAVSSSKTTGLETSVLFNKDQIDSDVASAVPTALVIGPSTTLINEHDSSSTTAVIESGSVIELNDLLQGVQDAGQIGETIKDIVNNIVTRPDVPADDEPTTTTTSPSEETTEPSTEAATTAMSFEVSTLAPSFNPSTTSEKTTPSLNAIKKPDAKFPVYIASQNLPKYYMTSSEEKVIFSTQAEGNSEPEQQMSTRYVTSIEKAAKTLTLTSTKVYYTRDSPLTITSIHTTTLPPITYVSTIIGSKTILGTYNSITPTKSSIMEVTTSTATVTSSMLPAPTTRPRLHRPKNQEQPTLLKAKVTPFLSSQKKPSKPSMNKPMVTPPSVFMNTSLEADLCSPSCNMTNKEYCKEESGKYTCECRPGFVRRPSDSTCQEIKNYLVVVRVSKSAESEVASQSTGNEVQSYTRVARRLGKANGIADLQVLSVERSSRKPTMVNLTIQLDPSMNPNVQEDLSKKLSSLGQVEKVVDFDECSSPLHNDCSSRARCINEPGSYRCQCLDNFIDLDATMPGRLCVSEVKSCDFCYGRGDCWRSQANTVCRCHPMFIGRRCEINGLLLAILVPIIAILVIVAIICFLYCSRKLRQRNRRFKNLAAYGPVAVIGGTLDRKAMLETSSESSDPQHRSSHYNSESNPASARGSMVRRNGNNGATRRESEPSLDRSLGTYSATGSTYNSMPPQILIPRARPPYTIHPGQVYMW